MEEICPTCGLPKSLCVCGQISKESQKIRIRTVNRRFSKQVTLLTGFGKDTNIKELAKELKSKLACGGTVKGDEVELQGSHKQHAKETLLKMGYREEQIDA